jgi:hypothetical protein
MAYDITTQVVTAAKVYKLRVTIQSLEPIVNPEQLILDDEDLYHEILALAGLSEDTIFVSAIKEQEGYIGDLLFYVLLLTLDAAPPVATGHEHDSSTLNHPLREAYRDGPYIDLDSTLGPVDIWADKGTVGYFQIRDGSEFFLKVDQDGFSALGGHLTFEPDTTFDIGSKDDGVQLYRPRDVYIGRDSYTARDGYFGTSAQSPTYYYEPTQLATPSTDPAKRLSYWNTTDNMLHVWDGTTDYALGGGSPGTDADGVIFIENLTPNVGNIDCTFAENGTRVTLGAATPDVTTITVHVFAYTGHLQVRPEVLVNGVATTWSTVQQKDPTAYEGTVNLSGFTLPYTITAVHQDGNSYSVDVVADAPPVIGTLEFVNGYPGSQTELKAVDTFDINVQADLNFVAIEVEDSGACSSMSFAVASTNNYTFAADIANRGTTTQALPARVRVQKVTGAWSDWVYTNAGGGTVDGTNLVNLNNTYPSIDSMNQGSITYPATQQAIKDAETVTIHSTCTDFDTISYTSPNAELSIPSSTTYAENKAGVARIAGGYNISAVNYRISANRAANDATSAETLVVYIAHDFAQIQMTEPASRLRTGGNDGTVAQNHTITLTANQRLITTPTIAAPPAGGGTWQGAGFVGGPEVWTRALQCIDNDTVGTYSYGTLVATNLANRITTTYTGDSNYTIGGFVSRTVTLAAFANETTFNAAVADYSKCTLVWAFKSLPNRRAFNTTVTPDPNSWCFAGTIGVSPTTARILDTAATGSSSNATAVTVEESV